MTRKRVPDRVSRQHALIGLRALASVAIKEATEEATCLERELARARKKVEAFINLRKEINALLSHHKEALDEPMFASRAAELTLSYNRIKAGNAFPEVRVLAVSPDKATSSRTSISAPPLWTNIEKADRDVESIKRNFGELVPLPTYQPHVSFLHIVSSPGASLQLYVSSIVLEVMRVTQADKCFIYFVNEVRKELWCVGSVEMAPFSLPLEVGVLGLVAKEGKLINLADPKSHKDFDPGVENRSGYVINSLLAFPVKHTTESARTIGVIQVLNKVGMAGSHFSEEDAEEMQKFSMLITDSFCRQRVNALQSRGDSDAQSWIAQSNPRASARVMPQPKQAPVGGGGNSNQFWVHYSRSPVDSGKSLPQDLHTVNFDVFAHEDNQLVSFVPEILSAAGIREHLGVKQEIINAWTITARKSYRDNPFHNWRHAFSTFQVCYCQLHLCDVFSCIRTIDAFGLLVAALCHDLDHPGYTNSYLIDSQDELAIRYNDVSVLEHHHAVLACELLRKPLTAIAGALERVVQIALREIVVKCILETDMARHSELTSQIVGFNASSYRQVESPGDQQLRLSACIHAADLSGQTSMWPIAAKWEQRIAEEFHNQAKLEVAAGRTPAAFMNFALEDAKLRGKLQRDFVDYILLPMWEPYVLVLPELKRCYENLVQNRANYDRRSLTGDDPTS